MKDAKRLTGVVLGALLAASLCGCAAGGGEAAAPVEDQVPVGESETQVPLAAPNTPLPFEAGYEGTLETTEVTADELGEILSFTLCGANYELPCAMTPFVSNGWNMDPSSGTESLPAGYMGRGPVLTNEEDVFFCVSSLNNTDSEVGWEGFTVCGAEISKGREGSAISNLYSTAGGLSIGDAGVSAVDIYGDPYFVMWDSDGGKVRSMEWKFACDGRAHGVSSGGLTVTLAEDGTVSGIGIDANTFDIVR